MTLTCSLQDSETYCQVRRNWFPHSSGAWLICCNCALDVKDLHHLYLHYMFIFRFIPITWFRPRVPNNFEERPTLLSFSGLHNYSWNVWNIFIPNTMQKALYCPGKLTFKKLEPCFLMHQKLEFVQLYWRFFCYITKVVLFITHYDIKKFAKSGLERKANILSCEICRVQYIQRPTCWMLFVSNASSTKPQPRSQFSNFMKN